MKIASSVMANDRLAIIDLDAIGGYTLLVLEPAASGNIVEIKQCESHADAMDKMKAIVLASFEPKSQIFGTEKTLPKKELSLQ